MVPEGHAVAVAGIADFTFGGLALRQGLALTLILLANLFSLAVQSRLEGVDAGALRAHLLGLAHLDVGMFTSESLDALLFGPVGLLLPLLLFFAHPRLAGIFVLLRLRALPFGDLVRANSRPCFPVLCA